MPRLPPRTTSQHPDLAGPGPGTTSHTPQLPFLPALSGLFTCCSFSPHTLPAFHLQPVTMITSQFRIHSLWDAFLDKHPSPKTRSEPIRRLPQRPATDFYGSARAPTPRPVSLVALQHTCISTPGPGTQKAGHTCAEQMNESRRQEVTRVCF